MDDASLDDFLADERDESAADDGSGDAGAADDDAAVADDGGDTGVDEGRSPAEGVEPARSTMTVSPAPVACEDCGDAVRRRWRDGDHLVCHACKEW